MNAPHQIDWLAEFGSRATHPPLPRARKRDPETSHAAAARAESFVAGHEAKCYAAICDAGERGATYREIATTTGLEPVAVGRRLGAMGKRGLITRHALTDCSGFESRDGMAIWRKR